eukprot:COSAG03_NODE_10889_length_623_cov_1.671756_3_plen_48_part_01
MCPASKEQRTERREQRGVGGNGGGRGLYKGGHNSAMVGGATNPDDMCE